MTLSHALVANRSLPVQALMVLAGSILIAASARVEVPMYPVPMTLQTLVISLVGLAYGARLGALTVLAYLAEGAAGLPVFSGGNAGIGWLLGGPTAGFLWGFVGMAWATGWLAERMAARGFAALFVAAVVPAMLLFVAGGGWPLLAGVLGMQAPWTAGSLSVVWAGWIAPFLIGGVVKSAIAALMIAGGWKAVTRAG
ncbi:MAG: biotin transporter BioY [Paracoccaceae bacterium]|nr:MAG: biotin transporter BioY [Paracoccaceae bacterium]